MASSAYHAPAATACSQQEPARQFTIPSDAAVHQEQQPPSMAAYQAFMPLVKVMSSSCRRDLLAALRSQTLPLHH